MEWMIGSRFSLLLAQYVTFLRYAPYIVDRQKPRLVSVRFGSLESVSFRDRDGMFLSFAVCSREIDAIVRL